MEAKTGGRDHRGRGKKQYVQVNPDEESNADSRKGQAKTSTREGVVCWRIGRRLERNWMRYDAGMYSESGKVAGWATARPTNV